MSIAIFLSGISIIPLVVVAIWSGMDTVTERERRINNLFMALCWANIALFICLCAANSFMRSI